MGWDRMGWCGVMCDIPLLEGRARDIGCDGNFSLRERDQLTGTVFLWGSDVVVEYNIVVTDLLERGPVRFEICIFAQLSLWDI